MYDYEDFEDYGPSDELSQQIHQMIENEARAKIASTFTELEQSRKSNEELRKQIQEMRNQIRTFEDRVKKELKETEDKTKREFTNGYKVRDKVYVPNGRYDHEKCGMCAGEGTVTAHIKDELTEIKCPKCNGNKRNSKYVLNVLEDRITHISVTFYESGSKDVRIYTNRRDSSVDENHIFATLEECQAYCDEKNAAATN